MDTYAQLLGAALILIAFIQAQRKRWEQDGRAYLWLNLLGAVTLAVVALRGQQWGFLLLEVVWSLVSLRGLLSPRDVSS